MTVEARKMHLAEYQAEAIKTRQAAAAAVPDPVIPLLGLAGEAGELLSEYKKWLRDGDAHSAWARSNSAAW